MFVGMYVLRYACDIDFICEYNLKVAKNMARGWLFNIKMFAMTLNCFNVSKKKTNTKLLLFNFEQKKIALEFRKPNNTSSELDFCV